MPRVSSVLIAFILLTATGKAAVERWIVRLDSFGPIKIGMSLSQLNKAINTSYSKPADHDEESCFYVEVPNHKRTGLMILNGRVARVDVDDPATQTAQGLHVGDSESRALEIYGKRLVVEPHHYLPENGHYLTMLSPDRKYGLRFETEDGKITSYYAGTVQAISFIEGCS